VIIRMGKARYAWVTILPLAWLAVVTTTAGWAKLFSDDPRLGFLAHARFLRLAMESGTLPPGVREMSHLPRLIFNDYLDAAVAGFFLVAVVVVLAASIHQWRSLLRGDAPLTSTEVPYEPMVAA
jgi:carbon starvation protein